VAEVVKSQNALFGHLEICVVIERLLECDFRVFVFNLFSGGFTASPKVTEH
jgi:hypothetical protein